jgi:hypothetical protein
MSGTVSGCADLLEGRVLGEAPRFTERAAFSKSASGNFLQRGFHFTLESGTITGGTINGVLR